MKLRGPVVTCLPRVPGAVNVRVLAIYWTQGLVYHLVLQDDVQIQWGWHVFLSKSLTTNHVKLYEAPCMRNQRDYCEEIL